MSYNKWKYGHDLHRCPVPNCPVHPPAPPIPDPRCICNKPLLLYIPPGQHFHCPVHPDMVIYGNATYCSTGTVKVGPLPRQSGESTGDGFRLPARTWTYRARGYGDEPTLG